jgi:microcystin-dependent protein
MSSILRITSANTARTKPTTGDTKTSFVDTDHLGWLKCDGRSLDTTAYNLLFQVIGYTFGGSGANFNLPNAQGRVIGNKGTIVDACDPSGVPFPAGTVLGEVNHKLTIAEMPAHNHDNATGSPGANTTAAGTTSSYTHNHGGTTGNAGQAAESETVVGTVAAVHTDAIVSGSNTHNHTIASDTHTHTIASNGGDACHNNMQPTLFYGNMFVYSGVPINATTVFPMKVGLAPMLL